MSSALYIVLDREVPGLDTFMNGKALAAAEEVVTANCERLNVRDLWSFYSVDPLDVADPLDGLDDFGDLDVREGPTVEAWFPPTDGLATVRALREALPGKTVSAVLADLGEMERILAEAERAGARWYLAVDH
ncbi:MAG: hypothetical protein QOF89_2875 [Acidobacteriota bacterium]|jgi:hypothetical protein|nr:hypothetical protein [Acidobacteriota bacterium]